jgi:hypothetical protein
MATYNLLSKTNDTVTEFNLRRQIAFRSKEQRRFYSINADELHAAPQYKLAQPQDAGTPMGKMMREIPMDFRNAICFSGNRGGE